MSLVGKEIRLTPVPSFPGRTAREAAGLLSQRGRKVVSDKAMRAKIHQTINARDAATRS